MGSSGLQCPGIRHLVGCTQNFEWVLKSWEMFRWTVRSGLNFLSWSRILSLTLPSLRYLSKISSPIASGSMRRAPPLIDWHRRVSYIALTQIAIWRILKGASARKAWESWVSKSSRTIDWPGRRIDFPSFERALARRRSQVELTPEAVLQNGGTERTESKRALLSAIQAFDAEL